VCQALGCKGEQRVSDLKYWVVTTITFDIMPTAFHPHALTSVSFSAVPEDEGNILYRPRLTPLFEAEDHLFLALRDLAPLGSLNPAQALMG
jgi:hypothetical protein